MRFNEKELVLLSRQPSERAAELGMRGPKKGDVVKKRLVKLVVNFLFYFRTDEEEPIGALLLEQCRVEREDSQTFSIAFLDEAERKYVFECDTEEQCAEWIDSIIKASYEFMRKNLIFYRTEIHRLTGKVRPLAAARQCAKCHTDGASNQQRSYCGMVTVRFGVHIIIINSRQTGRLMKGDGFGFARQC
uniref:Pleckstrin homology domain-containing family J member 1 n=1 Tax=Astatotilapia calliptera TaxID=8154 RepID=A0AAX7TMC3_ASTCA